MGEYVHSKQARFDKSYVSCGITEVHHLPNQTPAQTVFSIVNNQYHKANPRPSAFVMFSDVVEQGMEVSRGVALAQYLRLNMKGMLWESTKIVNPKTGNCIKVWIWQLDHDALRKWYAQELMHRVEEQG